MKPITSFFLLLTFCFCTPAYGDSPREVELIDGSVIRAQVLSMDGKTYRLHSETLGEIEIPEYRVKAIHFPTAGGDSPQPHNLTTSPQQFQQEPMPTLADTEPLLPNSPPTVIPSTNDLQRALSQDPAAMNSILSLRDDLLVQSILSDEHLMEAIHAGDLGELMNDPKIRALMRHPTVRGLSGQYRR